MKAAKSAILIILYNSCSSKFILKINLFNGWNFIFYNYLRVINLMDKKNKKEKE